MTMVRPTPTRGSGLLERYLSVRRASQTIQALASCVHRDALLDLGCGMHSGVLARAPFRERYALDQLALPALPAGVQYTQHNLTLSSHLPYRAAQFNAVTMLALIEHLPAPRVAELCKEIYRVLAPDGVLFLTTPRPGTNIVLRMMARMHLVSKEEIAEHTHEYGYHEISSLLADAGFLCARIRHGAFLCGLNTWTCARK